MSSKRWEGTAIVLGPAVSQGSKNIGRARGSGRPLVYDADPRLKVWRSQMQGEMAQTAPETPVDGPCKVGIQVWVLRPRSHYGTGKNADRLKESAPPFPRSGRDLDKCARAVLDAGSGIWWRDDAQVAELHVLRFYARQEQVQVWATEL